MNIEWYIVLSALLFTIGAIGILVRRSPMVILLCLELMLNAGNLALVAFARANGNEEPKRHLPEAVEVAAAKAMHQPEVRLGHVGVGVEEFYKLLFVLR